MRIINTKSIRTISVVVALLIGIIYNSIDVYAETEATLKSKLQAATSSQIREFFYEDLNGDGKKEAIGITSKEEDELGYPNAKVWYVTGTKCVVFADCEGWALYPDSIQLHKLKGTRMLTFHAGAGGSGWITYLYTFDKNGAMKVDNAMEGIEYLGKNNFIVYDSQFDAFKDGSGHTWNAYYSKWDGKKLVEYGGLKISQSQLKKVNNGSKILKEVNKKGKIGEIYYRANNLIFVNYTTKDANYNVTLKLKDGKVSYYPKDVAGKATLKTATNPGIIHKSITSCVKYPKEFPQK